MNDFHTVSNETFINNHDVRRPIGRVGFGRPGFGFGFGGFGRRPFGFGFNPFLGGLAGGLLGATLLSPFAYGYGYGYPPPYYGYPPYPYYY
ncbi:MAG: spore coat protein [Bacillota bacterium]